MKQNQILIQKRDIKVENDIIKIGLIRIELKAISAIVPEPIFEEENATQKFKVFLRYKAKNYETVYMNLEALKYLTELWEALQLEDYEKKLRNIEQGNQMKKMKVYGGIKYNLQIFLIACTLIAVLATKSYGQEQNNFPYTSVYDVNKDTCSPISDYKNAFSYDEIKNSKLVAEFPQRPGELVFLNSKYEMYVFVDTIEHCLSYRNHFLEDLEKQLKEEESKYDYSDLDDDPKDPKNPKPVRGEK